MANPKSVLKALSSYQYELERGRMPKKIKEMLESAKRYDSEMNNAAKIAFSTMPYASSGSVFSKAGIRASRASFMLQRRRDSIIAQPEYFVGLFAEKELVLAGEGRELEESLVAKNREAVESYRSRLQGEMKRSVQ